MATRSPKPAVFADVWWQTIPALPTAPSSQAYFALRRVWGDHTIAGARSFYRLGSEDNLTPALFQIWAIFDCHSWLPDLVSHCGGKVLGAVTHVQWAYACEEVLDHRLRPDHGRDFVTPDIMLRWEDEAGEGILVFEVKKPGTAVEAKDYRKIATYCDLPSTRSIGRRLGCFLLGESAARRTNHVSNSEFPILTWEQLADMQLRWTEKLDVPDGIRQRARAWLVRHFDFYGVRVEALAAPQSFGPAFGSEASHRAISKLEIPESLKLFFLGSECAEALRQGLQPVAPLRWLEKEPTVDDIRRRKFQSTDDRRINRWNRSWRAAAERTWT